MAATCWTKLHEKPLIPPWESPAPRTIFGVKWCRPSAENTARNLLLSQRVSTESPFVSLDAWKSCGALPRPFDGPVYAGLDSSAHTDLTVQVIVGDVDGVWQVQPHFWTPEQELHDRAKRDRTPYDVRARQGLLHTTPSATVDYKIMTQNTGVILADLDVRPIAFDR